jgi:Ni,Fe-hydrogenase III large subunit/Ni,Fe-hydrogenase III component G
MSDYGDIQIASAQDAIFRELQHTAGDQIKRLSSAEGEARALVPSYLFTWAAELLLFRGARFLSHTALDERPAADSFRVIVAFSIGTGKGIFSLEVQLPKAAPTYPSLTPKISAAYWAEQEAQEMLSIIAQGHPANDKLLRLPPHQYPLRYSFLQDKYKTQPSFTSTYTDNNSVTEQATNPLQQGARYHLQRDGEVLIQVESEHFHHHRGIEKQIQGNSFSQSLTMIERICIRCCVSNAASFCGALERMGGVLAPPRARALRVMALELERIIGHAANLSAVCERVAISGGSLYANAIKETCHRLNAALFGHRYAMNFLTPGGVARDVTAEQQRHVNQKLKQLDEHLSALMGAIEAAPDALERLSGLGVLSEGLARELGVVGVAARASNINIDLRRDHAYDGYLDEHVAPQIFTDTAGDAAARLKLRVFEIKESLSLLQTINSKDLPNSPIRQELGVLTEGASAIGYTEGAQGENIAYVLVGRDNTIRRYHLRSASFANALLIRSLCVGEAAEDFPLIESSIGLCHACIDR